MTTTQTRLSTPAVAVLGSGLTHAAAPDQDETRDGWARTYCGRMASVDHLFGGAPMRATADALPTVTDDGDVVAEGVDCLVCSAAVARWEAAR